MTMTPNHDPACFTSKGTRWPTEWSKPRIDPKTGVKVRQLTNYKGHSYPLYFTNPGWYDGGRKLLLGSDRHNRSVLMSLDLASGELVQLTDRPLPPPPGKSSFLLTCLNPKRAEAYYWQGLDLIRLDLHTLEERIIFRAPDGFMTSILNCTADGRYICTGIFEDLSSRFPMDLFHGYVGFAECHDAYPTSRILRIANDGSDAQVVWEEKYWIGHVNTSPTQSHLLSFCHEGPWEKVDQRIWGFDLRTGKAWKIRPPDAGDLIGHEYWLADGESLGYGGQIKNGPGFGFIRYDNTEWQESVMDAGSVHFHSNNRDLVVGDGTQKDPYILLWRRKDSEIEPARILCGHRSSFHVQETHVHPCFSPDGKHVLYASDASGYGNLYLADVPEIDSLPKLR